MTYKWDNKKPTAQMLGRWQPFHDGHYTLFKEIIKKTGQVCIQIRDVQGVDDNPFDFETVKKKIEERLNPEFEGRFKIMLVPNITNICYGRGVGYKIPAAWLRRCFCSIERRAGRFSDSGGRGVGVGRFEGGGGGRMTGVWATAGVGSGDGMTNCDGASRDIFATDARLTPPPSHSSSDSKASSS